jgi:hypothetical protein
MVGFHAASCKEGTEGCRDEGTKGKIFPPSFLSICLFCLCGLWLNSWVFGAGNTKRPVLQAFGVQAFVKQASILVENIPFG